MTNLKIAFQGELGAYSHIACEKLFPGSSIRACSTFEETFRTAHEDKNCQIVVPIENSLAGRIADIHYLLPKYKLQIYAEHFQTVEHNLLVKENTELKDIKYIRSHGQAIDLDDTFGKATNAEMYHWIKENLDFDQMIWEFGDDDNPDWVHISYVSPEDNRNRCLKAYKDKGKTKYMVI